MFHVDMTEKMPFGDNESTCEKLIEAYDLTYSFITDSFVFSKETPGWIESKINQEVECDDQGNRSLSQVIIYSDISEIDICDIRSLVCDDSGYYLASRPLMYINSPCESYRVGTIPLALFKENEKEPTVVFLISSPDVMNFAVSINDGNGIHEEIAKKAFELLGSVDIKINYYLPCNPDYKEGDDESVSPFLLVYKAQDLEALASLEEDNKLEPF